MRILTIVKQVPDSTAVIKVRADGSGIETAGVKFVMNPFDEFGVEQALRIRESGQPVEEIVAITVGGARAAETLRTALAMGADRAIHVVYEGPAQHNELHLAEMLAAAIREEPPYDMILTGKQAIDMDAGEIGPGVAEFLDLPHVGAITAMEFGEDGRTVTVRRRIEGAEEVVRCVLPGLFTCEKGLCEPRYPSLPNLMKAKKKPLVEKRAEELGGLAHRFRETTELVSMAPPPPRPPCRMLDGSVEEMARELVRLLREEAKVI